jgi:hypothetical protein
MKSKIIPVCIFLIGLIVSACNVASVETVQSNSVAPSEIFQGYSISANKNSISAEAVFRIGGATGTTLDLIAPSRVEYNETAMQKSAAVNSSVPIFSKGTTYSSNSNVFRPNQQFVYTASDGKIYRNSISLAPLELALKKPLVFSTKTATAIPLSRPLATDEKLEISLDETIFDDISLTDNTVYLDTARKVLIVTPAFLKEKEVKKSVNLTVKVSKSQAIKETTARGGNISFSYQSAEVGANISAIPMRKPTNKSVAINKLKTANKNVNSNNPNLANQTNTN